MFFPGIVGLSETAATARVQGILTRTYSNMKIHSAWSAPVRPYANSSAELRGVAGGTAVMSSFPLRSAQELLPQDFISSSRFVETHVQFQPHRFAYVACLYGPHQNYRFADPLQMMNRLLNVTAQRAVRFQGPAVIMGDFNYDLQKLEDARGMECTSCIGMDGRSSSICCHQQP